MLMRSCLSKSGFWQSLILGRSFFILNILSAGRSGSKTSVRFSEKM